MSTAKFRRLDCQADGDVLVLTIRDKEIQGEDVANGLRDEMLAAAAEFSPRHVVVNFVNIEYISSVAFWPLLSLHRKLQEQGGRVTVCGLNPTVGDVFYNTRLISPGGSFTAPFGVETDVKAAVARLRGTM